MALRLRWFAVVGWLVFAATAAAQPGGPYRGRTVQSVIDELRAAGAPLVYSSNLLSSTLRVESEPASSAPLDLAREVLAAHGLTVRDEAGVWLVVRGEPPVPAPALPARLVVTVQGAYSGLAIAAGSVQVDPPAGPVVAVVDGRAELAGLAPGRHSLTVRGQGFLPERLTVNATAGAEVAVTVGLFEGRTA